MLSSANESMLDETFFLEVERQTLVGMIGVSLSTVGSSIFLATAKVVTLVKKIMLNSAKF